MDIQIIIAFVVGGVVGFIISVFVYRNNAKSIGKVADKIDEISEVLKKKK